MSQLNQRGWEGLGGQDVNWFIKIMCEDKGRGREAVKSADGSG